MRADTAAIFRSRALVTVACLLLAVIVVPAGMGQQERTDEPEIGAMTEQQILAAIVGLEQQAMLNDELMERAARAHRLAAAARNAALQALERALRRLDDVAENVEGLTAGGLEEATETVEQARATFATRERETQGRIEDLRRLVEAREILSTRIASLRSRIPSESELLTGVWEVRWFPGGVTGTFTIDQSGTLVTGQYALRPIGSGSLQGTFVNGKLFLQRIDRQRGRDAELEGYLDPDGSQIRGTWQSYELVQGGIPNGQWVARRVK
jgi:HPt (histidine-containing phosphotransfer) domain-containing protein